MKTLLLLDGSSYLYRAYHALPDLRTAAGEPTGALRGFISMLRTLRQQVPADYLACVFDAKGKTFRDELYAEYKANRAAMPEDLVAQIAPIHEAARALGWPVIEIEGIEADDVIGTLARYAAQHGLRTVISTGDKDLAQLVDERTTLVNTMSGETLDVPGVEAKFGVPPTRIVDYLTLVGDSVDNVPGVEKVGPKTAAKWLQTYGSLDAVVERAGEIGGVVGDNLRKALPWLPTARTLVTVRTDCDLAPHVPDLAALAMREEDPGRLRELYGRYEFKSWLREIGAADAAEAPAASAPANATNAAALRPEYETVLTREQLAAWLQRIGAAELTCVDTETTSLDPMAARLV
ncbi:MAG TPA: 5'-3' exonuclease H3TH domain-containing protein, partial [Burkholderiaceae bacterium]|nr:5'-3' exonuclease H3TH domain-containing protein [Burkholderiaceae bacterium]